MHRVIVYACSPRTPYILLVKRKNTPSAGWCVYSNNRYVNSIYIEYSMVIK